MQLNKKPLVSAIVSTYNSEKFIRGKIEDLLNQTIVDKLEIIIVNSGSQQNEDAIVQEYLKNLPNIKYIKTSERETIYKAWNTGIKCSTGKYITNSNTDDRLKKDALEILAYELDKNPNVALVYANQFISHIPNQKFDSVKNKKIWTIPNFDYLVQLDRCVVLSQPMWRSSLHFADGIWFNETLEICGDQEFDLRISQKYSIKYLPITLGTFYVDPQRENISLKDMKRLEKEKLGMTKGYIAKYVEELDYSQLVAIKNKFEFLIKFPIPILRGSNILLKYLIPQKHRFTHEFVYYVMALIYKRQGNNKEAINCCEKVLRRKNSPRIVELLEKLKVP